MLPLTSAIIFDLDGCLVDSEALALEAIVQELQLLGVKDVDFDYIRAHFLGVSMANICAEFIEQASTQTQQAFVERVENRLFQQYHSKLRIITGVIPILSKLKQHSVLFAIATGASIRRMSNTLELSGLASWFSDSAFSVDQVQQGKPAPDIFLLAAEKLTVSPHHCLVVEDSPYGVEAAIAAGMRAIGFVGGSHLNGIREAHGQSLQDKGATKIIHDMSSFFKVSQLPDLMGN